MYVSGLSITESAGSTESRGGIPFCFSVLLVFLLPNVDIGFWY